MFTIVRKLLELLSAREKFYLYLQFAILAGMAFTEMAGIASILPFMAVVTNPDQIQTNRWLKMAYNFFDFHSVYNFLLFLGTLVLGLLIFSNSYSAMTTWLRLKFDNQLNYMLARRLLASYLARPYQFFLNRNTAEMGKNVLSEVRNVIAGVISPGMQVLSSGMIATFILTLLLTINPFIAVTIAVVLSAPMVLFSVPHVNYLRNIGNLNLKPMP